MINRSIKCLYTNADCLTSAKIHELRTIVQEEKYDIIAITEIYPKFSYFDHTIEELYKITDYNMTFGEKQGRGIVVYTYKNIISCKMNEDTLFKESVWLDIKLADRDRLLLGCIYRSPNGGRESVTSLLTMLGNMSSLRYTHLLIMGDFNLKNIDWEYQTANTTENQLEYTFIEGIKDLFLCQHVKEPTRHREGNIPSLLDLIFTNESEMIEEIFYQPGLGKSDHQILHFKFLCTAEHKSTNLEKLNYNKGEYNSMNRALEEFEWPDWSNMGVQMSWGIVSEQISKIIDKFIPKIPNTKGHRRAYIDSDTARAIREKERNG